MKSVRLVGQIAQSTGNPPASSVQIPSRGQLSTLAALPGIRNQSELGQIKGQALGNKSYNRSRAEEKIYVARAAGKIGGRKDMIPEKKKRKENPKTRRKITRARHTFSGKKARTGVQEQNKAQRLLKTPKGGGRHPAYGENIFAILVLKRRG